MHSRFLKNLFFTGSLLLSITIAQEIKPISPFPHTGSGALEFEVYNLLSMRGHLGGSLTYKTFKTPDEALRIGVYLNSDGSFFEGTYVIDNYYIADDSLVQSETDIYEKRNTSTFFILAQRLKYMEPYHSVALVYGAGPILGVSFFEDRVKDASAYNLGLATRIDKRLRMIPYVGVATSIGAEWFMHPNFSLSGEYHTQFKIGYERYSTGDTNDYYNYNATDYSREKSGAYYDLYSRVFLGLSIYFK